jgi:phage portal protein BeeE
MIPLSRRRRRPLPVRPRRDDPRKGYSPLKSVLREVFTDDEAANFTASLLKNMGVPGVVVSPEKGVTLNDGDAEETKAYVKANFTGDKRGEALVMTGATKVEQFGFSPEQLTLKELRRIPEERVSAVTGVPAIVAGLGAGLDRSTFTNYAEAREAAYEQAIIPTQTLLGEEVWFQLLPDFEARTRSGWKAGFDLSNVRVLQEDRFQPREAARPRRARRLGLGRREARARREGLPVDRRRRLPAADEPRRGARRRRRSRRRTRRRRRRSSPRAARASSNGHAHLTPEELREVIHEQPRRRARRFVPERRARGR